MIAASVSAGSHWQEDELFLVRGSPPQELAERSAEAGIGISSGWFAYVLFDAMETSIPMEVLAPEENIGFILLHREREFIPVFLGKIREGNDLRGFLEKNEYHVFDYRDWTFATRKPASPEDFAPRLGDWIERVRRERRDELEIDLNLPKIGGFARTAVEDWFSRAGGLQFDFDALLESLERKLSPEELQEFREALVPTEETFLGIPEVLDLALAQLEDIVSARMTVSLNAERIRLFVHLVPENKSPLTRMLRAEHSASSEIAEWLAPDGDFFYLAGTDNAAVFAYLEEVSKPMETGLGINIRESLRENREIYENLGAIPTAGSVVFPPGNKEPKFLQISELRIPEDRFIDFIRGKSGWFALDAGKNLDIVPDVELIADNPVYAFRAAANAEQGHGADETEWLGWFVRIEDLILYGDDREKFFETAARVAAGEKPEDSAAGFFKQDDAPAFLIAANHVRLIGRVAFFLGEGIAEETASLPPVVLSLKFADGEASASLDTPVALMRVIRDRIESLMEIVSEEKILFDPME